MSSHSSLGMEWRPFHEQRVFNAVDNILNTNPMSFFGLTTWDAYSAISFRLDSGLGVKSYIVSSAPYAAYLLITKLFGFEAVRIYGPLVDYILIVVTGVISSEITYRILVRDLQPSNSIWPLVGFILYLSTPWTYRMSLALWDEVIWILFLLLFFLLILHRQNLFACASLIIAGITHWAWTFMLALFYIFCLLMLMCDLDRGTASGLLPPPFRSKRGRLLMIAAITIPLIIALSQPILLQIFYDIHHSGSGALYRIGIDSPTNIHHGGFLASLQFLGGNRLSNCLNVAGHLSNLEYTTARLNCFTSILGWAMISTIAFIGYTVALYRLALFRWILLPLAWVFVAFYMLFQQSTAVHLQGYSFVFVPIFSFGLVYLMRAFCIRLNIGLLGTLLFIFPLLSGIVITAIRVSFITGVNG